MEFKEYQSVKAFGKEDVDGILDGYVYVYPKLDGTNASIWFEDGEVQAGSRRRHLFEGSDNAGFRDWVMKQEWIIKFFEDHPNIRLFGEWLVPHTLKTYNDKAWRQFYVFDIIEDDIYQNIETVRGSIEEYGFKVIPCIAEGFQLCIDDIVSIADDENHYLIDPLLGVGEGVVVKRYGFINKYNRVNVWAKYVRPKFKQEHGKVMGFPKEKKYMEDKIVKYLTGELIRKEYIKFVIVNGDWKTTYIQRLFSSVFKAFLEDELWSILKKKKNPTINFRTLFGKCVEKIKITLPELF